MLDGKQKEKENTVTYKDITRFAFHYWGRRRWLIIAAVGFLTVSVGVDAVVPLYTGGIVDALIAEDRNAFLTRFLIFAALSLTHTLCWSTALFFWNKAAIPNLADMMNDISRKVLRFSTDWHANAFAGATVRKITRAMWSFDKFEDTLFMGLLPAVVIMTGMTIMLLNVAAPIGLYALAVVSVYVGVSAYLSVKVLAPRYSRSAERDTAMGATLADIVTGVPTVKAFGAEKREDARLGTVVAGWRGIFLNAVQTSQVVDLLRSLIRNVMISGMIAVAAWLWSEGRVSPGAIVTALTGGLFLGGYLREIGRHIAELQRSASEMADGVAFWMRTDDIRDRPGAMAFRPGKGSIVFDRVRFAYGNQSAPVYEDFSLRIAPGEKIALAGPSGSGKSTFVKLVQRLYDVQAGAVRIDGQDIAAVTQESLRRAIALVPQEPILFHRSLAENIAYARPDAAMEDVVRAAKQAYAHDFIAALPQGYDTLVGERGIKLSGGERQRVAIARAILADAPILILDEATSALDSVSEHYIQKALAALSQGRTVITIAHRLATIKSVDRILVFDGGRVIEQGSHAELIRRDNSLYRRLFEMQALDLIGEEAA